MTIQQYITNLNTLFITGNAREHSYRGDLQNLLSAILPDILVTNEPARVECGAPDYVLTRKNIPIGYIEAKDIGVDLKSKTLKEQFERYKSGLSNLIITDYLEFKFYKDANLLTQISIGKIENGKIIPITENFKEFTNLIKNFSETISQSIKSPTRLAEMMAGKAKLMADVIEKSLNNDDKLEQRSNLKSQMISFKQMLIHDIDNKAFADIYAQTIAYGMFAARYHDPSLEDFSRTEAANLIPKSNPFLRKLFQDIAGYDLDDRLVWIVDELVNIFLASDVAQIMKNFGKATKQEDPVVHFYETFLGEYSPKLRKARGVWYTPQPVVNFIVRAVDEVLKTDFNLPQGLADTSKTKVKVNTDIADKRSATGYKQVEQEVHKVQILDPATGTGTFLAEVVRHIHKKFKGQQGIWSKYVKTDLIPRLNGFELLMASYAMAHLKMDMLLTETGYKATDNQRLRIYLTNSLEEAHPDTGTLFSSWLSDEADQANAIKRDTPVMVVIGNPPYSGESANKGDWIMSLMDSYKKEPNTNDKLKEKNSKWINDDYVKFMRFGQHFIEKNGEGILAFINPHGFLDNPTFRGMRWNLLKTYDTIHTIDLHGNAKKKEVCPDSSPDQNVFDIMQGVAINILVKTGKKKPNELGKVLHYDLYGKRKYKYDFLNDNNLSTLKFTTLDNVSPDYFFVPKDYELKKQYDKGIKLSELFPVNGNGIVTKRDNLCIQDTATKSFDSANEIITLEKNEFYSKYQLPNDVRDWRYEWAKEDVIETGPNQSYVQAINYRPFDKKYIYYTGKSRGFVGWPVDKIMKNYIQNNNLGLLCTKSFKDESFNHIFATNKISEAIFLSSQTGSNAMNLPLYILNTNNNQQSINGHSHRTPNLNPKIIEQIAKGLNLTFTNEKEDTPNTFAPIDLLDYIYAVLHSPTYRETYKEFLKIDFPHVPAPQDREKFNQLIKLGKELRQIHLLEHPTVENYITQYPEDGDNVITRKLTKNNIGYEATTSTHGKVWINDNQYFDNVPLIAWEFYIGGYQPAQKWLKDRKDRELSFEDILHYQKIIVALSETDRIMKEIDKIDI